MVFLVNDNRVKYSLILSLILFLLVFVFPSEAEKRHSEQHLEFVTEPTSQLVAADGGRAVFKCTASPDIADIRWLNNGLPLYQTSSSVGMKISRHKLVLKLPKTSKNNSSNSLSSDSIHLTQLFNGGFFQCIAQHKNRAIVSQTAKLILAELKPFAHKDNITLVAIAGNTAVIPCAPPYSVPNAVTEFTFNSTTTDSVIVRTKGKKKNFNSIFI